MVFGVRVDVDADLVQKRLQLTGRLVHLRGVLGLDGAFRVLDGLGHADLVVLGEVLRVSGLEDQLLAAVAGRGLRLELGVLGSVLLGGVIFNASNILLSASVSLAGLAVAFPLGVGLALVLGVVINYMGAPKGDPVILFLGVALIVIAIVCNGIASGRVRKEPGSSAQNRKGILLAVLAGVLMSFFYRFVAAAMDLDNFESPTPGMLTPYSAIFIFSVGVLLSNFVFNTLVMKRPFVGTPVGYDAYFKGSARTHLVGMLGGAVWCLGTAFSYIAAGKAGAAISYALGQGAPMVAAVWGVFVWKEFRGAGRSVGWLLAVMFLFFILGLACIILSGGN